MASVLLMKDIITVGEFYRLAGDGQIIFA